MYGVMIFSKKRPLTYGIMKVFIIKNESAGTKLVNKYPKKDYEWYVWQGESEKELKKNMKDFQRINIDMFEGRIPMEGKMFVRSAEDL